MAANDLSVQATNEDASACKCYAVQKGYWRDPFIDCFVKSTSRKPPEISRGYYARTRGIQLLITEQRCQILNLGCGFDTLFWLLHEEGRHPIRFVEVDFPPVTSRKCHMIKRSEKLLEHLASEDVDVQFSATELHSENYRLVHADLRNLDQLEAKFRSCSLDYALPTLFLTECVLVYMEENTSRALLAWAANVFQTALWVNYEQINMGDTFGQVMLSNLKARYCVLSGVKSCQSLDTQRQRYIENGWSDFTGIQMNDAYRRLAPTEIQRIEKLEFLDEKELLDQLMAHYCLCWASKDAANIGLNRVAL